MKANPNIYNVTLPDTYYRFFEVGAGYFMTQGGAKDYGSSFDYKNYKEFIGGELDPTTLTNKTITEGKILAYRI